MLLGFLLKSKHRLHCFSLTSDLKNVGVCGCLLVYCPDSPQNEKSVQVRSQAGKHFVFFEDKYFQVCLEKPIQGKPTDLKVQLVRDLLNLYI